jgi:hypothetical protein
MQLQRTKTKNPAAKKNSNPFFFNDNSIAKVFFHA